MSFLVDQKLHAFKTMQGPGSKFLSGGTKDERDSQIGGGGGGTILEILYFNSTKMTGNAYINSKLNFYFQVFSAVAIGS